MVFLDLSQFVRKQFRRWRKKTETVIAQLAGRFQIKRIRARDPNLVVRHLTSVALLLHKKSHIVLHTLPVLTDK
jgi:hypothetical protein